MEPAATTVMKPQPSFSIVKHTINFDELINAIINSDLDTKFLIPEIWLHIFKYVNPIYKKNELCIRMYKNMPTKYSKKKYREQAVTIESIRINNLTKEYFYNYNYYPASDGSAYENSLRKLSKKEKEKSIWLLPSEMVSL